MRAPGQECQPKPPGRTRLTTCRSESQKCRRPPPGSSESHQGPALGSPPYGETPGRWDGVALAAGSGVAVGFAGSGAGPAVGSETGILHPIFQGCQGWTSRAWGRNCSLLCLLRLAGPWPPYCIILYLLIMPDII